LGSSNFGLATVVFSLALAGLVGCFATVPSGGSGLVPEATGAAFHLFDGPVSAFGGGVGDAGLQEHQDRRSPPVDRLGQCVISGPSMVAHQS